MSLLLLERPRRRKKKKRGIKSKNPSTGTYPLKCSHKNILDPI